MTRAAILALVTCAGAGPVLAQAGAAPREGKVERRGAVVSKSDHSAIVAAEVMTVDGRVHVRTDEHGRFRIVVAAGDSLRVRALGFFDRRLAAGEDSVIALDPFAVVLSTVTTTAGQRTIRVNESTASSTVVSRDDIDAAAASAANQVLRQVPGLQETPSPPSKSTISIRGLDAARVLVLVDGEPVPGALIDNRDIGRLSSVATQRIEITKGPSSVEFGSDALGGVINLVTAAPSKSLLVDAAVRAGGLGRGEATADVSNTVGRLGYRVSGGWRQLDRLVAVNAEGTSLDRVYDVRTDARYHATDRLTLRGDVQLSQERQRYPVGGGYNGFIDNHSAQAFVEAQRLSSAGLFRARVFGQYYNYEFRQSQQLVPIAGSADSLEQVEKLGRVLLAYSRPVGSHTIDAGAQFSARSIVAPEKIEGDRASDRITEFFLRDAYTAGPVLVTVGGRSTTSSLWGNALTPSVGAAWQIVPALRARANLARGFRGPSFKEMRYTFVNPAAGYVIVGNADLVPESSWSTDAGLTWSPTARFALDADAYRNRVSNLIDFQMTGLTPSGYQTYQNGNVAHARTEGAELEARYELPGLSMSLGYNYLRARDEDTGQPLDRRATHSGRAQVSREWAALRNLRTDLSAHYTGSAPVGDTTQAAFLAVDAQLRLNVASRIELSTGVNNVFDERPALWTPAFQRQVFVGVRARFGAGE